MIGQKKNLELVKSWRLNRCTPRFLLITGEGERLELAKAFSNSLNSDTLIIGNKVDDIRTLIENSYQLSNTTTYIIEQADTMSNAAVNALLKVTEEPPNNAYFIMLSENSINILDTILSRATHLKMEAYTVEDLSVLTTNEKMIRYCRTPQQIKEWLNREKEFNEYVEWCTNIAANITKLTGVEVLKTTSKLKIKNEGEGYDVIQTVRIIADKIIEQNKLNGFSNAHYKMLMEFFSITTQAINDLQRTGVKKDSTYDKWILDIKEVLTK